LSILAPRFMYPAPDRAQAKNVWSFESTVPIRPYDLVF
jgi:hypothetical protein